MVRIVCLGPTELEAQEQVQKDVKLLRRFRTDPLTDFYSTLDSTNQRALKGHWGKQRKAFVDGAEVGLWITNCQFRTLNDNSGHKAIGLVQLGSLISLKFDEKTYLFTLPKSFQCFWIWLKKVSSAFRVGSV